MIKVTGTRSWMYGSDLRYTPFTRYVPFSSIEYIQVEEDGTTWLYFSVSDCIKINESAEDIYLEMNRIIVPYGSGAF